MKKPETERYECPFWPTLSTTPLHEYVVLNTDLIAKYALSMDKHRGKSPDLDNLITATGLMDLDVLLRNLPPDLGNQPCTRTTRARPGPWQVRLFCNLLQACYPCHLVSRCSQYDRPTAGLTLGQEAYHPTLPSALPELTDEPTFCDFVKEADMLNHRPCRNLLSPP